MVKYRLNARHREVDIERTPPKGLCCLSPYNLSTSHLSQSSSPLSFCSSQILEKPLDGFGSILEFPLPFIRRYHPSVCARCSICSKLGSVLLIQFRAWVISAGSTGTARGISSPLATSAPSYFTGFARLIGNFQ